MGITISGHTRLAGVVGWPIAHTLSPVMHNAGFQALGLPAVYIPLGVPPQGLSALFGGLRHLDVLGLNVTIPYKQAVIPCMDRLAASARQIGAVNTVVFHGRQLVGHNTDGQGFLRALSEEFDPRKKRAVVLGSGGAGRAVAITLARAGIAHLTLMDVDSQRVNRLLRDLKHAGFASGCGVAPTSPALQAELAQADVVVQTTPLGMHPRDPMPVPAAWLPRRICVMDVVYSRRYTPFLRAARRRACRVVPGWRMLLQQGVESFRLWTAQEPPLAVMRKALIQAGGILDR